MGVDRYPETLMPLAAQLPERHPRFAELRESFLLDYGYQTARAYWSDLESIHDWAHQLGKDMLGLTERDLVQYRALLRRRRYSEATVRRRLGTYRRFRKGCSLPSYPRS